MLAFREDNTEALAQLDPLRLVEFQPEKKAVDTEDLGSFKREPEG